MALVVPARGSVQLSLVICRSRGQQCSANSHSISVTVRCEKENQKCINRPRLLGDLEDDTQLDALFYSGSTKVSTHFSRRRDACTFSKNTTQFSMEPHTPSPRRISSRKEHSPHKRARIFALKDIGWSYRRIAAHEGISPGSVHGIVARYYNQNSAKSLPRSGRPPSLTERDIRYIYRFIDQNPFISCLELKKKAGLTCSTETIRRHLIKAGIQHYRALRRPKLTPELAAKRLAFARAYISKDLT